MYSNVNFTIIFIIGIIIFSIIGNTYQDEVKLWNKRLYPTNSVYESLQNNRQSSSSLKTNVVAVPLSNINDNTDGISESHHKDDEESEEIEYEDDDYKAEVTHEELKKLPDVKNLDNKTHNESKVDNSSKDDEVYYYYDDEYDNVTNSQASVGIEYDSSSSEIIPDKKNPSSSQSSIIKNNNNNNNKNQNDEIDNLSYDDEDDILLGEAIVSVVTTKSVVNSTLSLPITYISSTTEQMIRPPIETSTFKTIKTIDSLSKSTITTEDPIVVASVQTSRSISGARFLPFNLNGENPGVEKNKSNNNNNNNIKNISNIESTESIIDKLDRVQSELSGGFLAGGFRTAGNALQLDVLGEQRPTTKKTITTTGKTPIISRFMPRRYNDRRTVFSPIEAEISSTSSTTIKTDHLFDNNDNVDNNNNDNDDEPIINTNNKTKITFRWPSSSRKTIISSTKSPRIITTTTKKPKAKDEAQDISAFLPPGYKLKLEDKTTEKTIISDIIAKSKIDLSAFLPSNYKLKNITTTTTVKSLIDNPKIPIQNLFSKSDVDISAFLPPDYNKKIKIPVNDLMIVTTAATTTTTSSSPIQKSLQELFSKSSVDISSLLPAGYNLTKKIEAKTTEESMIIDDVSTKLSTVVMPTTKAPIKLVFPTRPGGRKAVPQKTTPIQARQTTTMKTIQKGWPTRLTTEFTGWPTPSTTPISIEKLLEAARTAKFNQINSSISPITSEILTTSTTTTTTTTIRPTTPGICEDDCEVAGTIRLIGNSTWIPELYDRNTNEWQQLANEIEKEMHFVFIKSAILRKWYKNVRIDAFSPGSILVDYFVELQDLSQRINTQELRVLFHDSLRTYNAHRWNETKIKGPMRLGEYIIDPKSTDFVIIPKLNLPQHIEKDDRWIPQWAIAMIVIGVGGLLFIIVFGVSVIVNRENAGKIKSPITGMYGEDAAKNIIHASQATTSNRSSHDYPKSDISTIWNDTNAWREKSFESQSHKVLMEGMLPDEKKYNVYDSWKSEWNGYYYQPSHTSSKFAGYESTANYSRHPPDYDTNF